MRYDRNGLVGFPLGAIAIALMIGVPAFVCAAIFCALAVEYSVGSYRILLFGDSVTGATVDIAVATALAVAFGAAGIVCILRLRTDVRMWRRAKLRETTWQIERPA